MKLHIRLIGLMISFLIPQLAMPANLLNLNQAEKAYLDSKPYLTVMNLEKFHPFAFLQDGKPVGYSVDVMRLLGQLLNKEIRFITDKTWKAQLEMLKQGEIDIIPYIVVTDERKAYVDYTDFLHLTYLIGFVAHENQTLTSMADLKGKTVAVVNKYYLHDHLQKHFPDINLLLTNSTQESIDAVADNRADATVDNLTTLNYFIRERWLNQLKVYHISDFQLPTEIELPMGVSKGDHLLKSILEKVNAALPQKDIQRLKQKWFSATERGLEFTPEEKAYLDSKPELSVMSLGNFQPFSFRVNEEPQGFSIETLRLIGESLGKPIRFVKKPWNDQLEMLKTGQLDIIPHLAITEERKQFADYTNFIHLTYLIGFATQKEHQLQLMDDLVGKKLAVVKGYYLHKHLEKNFPHLELLVVRSTEEAVKSVAQGKAFAVVDNVPTLNYFIQEKWLSNLKIASVNDFGLPLETHMPMGLTKGNQHLKSILEKVVAHIPVTQINTLKEKWLFSEKQQPKLQINLSEAEQTYLKTKQQISMCIDPDWMPFEANQNGNHIGMSADYFQLFEQAIGIPINLVPSKTWPESLQLGKARACDIFSLVMSTPERRQYLDFTQPYFSTPLVLATELHRPWTMNMNEIQEARIGIVKGYAYGELLRQRYPDMNLIDVNNLTEGLRQVEQGQLYGFIGTLAAVGYHIQQNHVGQLKINGKFPETWDLAVGTRNDEPQLQQIFNKVVQALSETEHQRIHNKWITVSIDEKIDNNALTDTEKQFLKQHPVIRFRVRSEHAPFEFSDNGIASGIAVDYIKAIADLIGFKAQFIIDDRPVEDAFKLMNSHQGPYDTGLFTVKSKAREKLLAFGDTYLSYPMMIITHHQADYFGKLSDLNGKTVVLEHGFLTNQWLKRDYPDIHIINAVNTAEALKLVNEGNADAYVGNLAIANYMMTYGGLDNIKIAAPTQYGNINYHFIAPKGWEALASILSKGYRRLPQQLHHSLQQKWYSLQMVKTYDYSLFWKVLAVVIFFVVWMLWWNRKLATSQQTTQTALTQLQRVELQLKEKNTELEYLSITDPLTQLYNRTKLDAILDHEMARSERYNSALGIIILDIDYFKRINDTFGHQRGDQVLIKFAHLLKENIRQVDTVGRWGGEEFVIICPEAKLEQTLKLAEKLRIIVERHSFEEVGSKTASFGLTAFREGDTSTTLLARADRALYDAKEQGRNRVVYR